MGVFKVQTSDWLWATETFPKIVTRLEKVAENYLARRIKGRQSQKEIESGYHWQIISNKIRNKTRNKALLKPAV